MSSKELLECPFCGENDELYVPLTIHEGEKYYSAQCIKCNITTQFCNNRECVIETWNTRTPRKINSDSECFDYKSAYESLINTLGKAIDEINLGSDQCKQNP